MRQLLQATDLLLNIAAIGNPIKAAIHFIHLLSSSLQLIHDLFDDSRSLLIPCSSFFMGDLLPRLQPVDFPGLHVSPQKALSFQGWLVHLFNFLVLDVGLMRADPFDCGKHSLYLLSGSAKGVRLERVPTMHEIFNKLVGQQLLDNLRAHPKRVIILVEAGFDEVLLIDGRDQYCVGDAVKSLLEELCFNGQILLS